MFKTAMLLVLAAVSFMSPKASASTGQERALVAYMQVVPGAEQAFLKAAVAVIRESREEAGNITYRLHQSVTNPQLFVFYEYFETHADLEFHKNAEHTKAFIRKTKPYTVKFTLEEFAPTEGLE